MKLLARLFVSLSLLLAAPGLAPYAAVAQVFSAPRVAVPAVPVGAAGAAITPLGGAASVLPAASLQGGGLIPTLSPSAVPSPVRFAFGESAPLTAAANGTPLAIRPVLKSFAVPSAVAASDSPQANRPALAVLQTGTNALSAAAKAGVEGTNDSPAANRAALDGLFEGSVAPSALRAEGLPVISAASDSPRLDPSAARGPVSGPRWVKTFRGPGDAPATSTKRTLSIGFLAAVIPIAITMVTVAIAQLLGYELHPNYQGPAGTATTTVLQALALWIGAAVMAPISEEAIFRGGIQGRLAKLAAKLRLGSFVAPAVVTSLIFVALHETSDPVLFATRFVHAMILSYVYHKEGILASMAAHGFFNGLLALSIVFSALGLPWLGLAVVPAALYFAVKAAKSVRAQKPDIASGALTPKPLSAALAVAMAGLLVLGYFFLMPNIFWPIGAVALLIAAVRIKMKKA